jgi:hypothetical protein
MRTARVSNPNVFTPENNDYTVLGFMRRNKYEKKHNTRKTPKSQKPYTPYKEQTHPVLSGYSMEEEPESLEGVGSPVVIEIRPPTSTPLVRKERGNGVLLAIVGIGVAGVIGFTYYWTQQPHDPSSRIPGSRVPSFKTRQSAG